MQGRRFGLIGRVALAATCVATVAVSAAPAAEAAPGNPVVATDRGPVRGIASPAMTSYLGIPYAAAPAGDPRWRPPQAHAPWAGVRDATRFAPHCPQVATPYGSPSE